MTTLNELRLDSSEHAYEKKGSLQMQDRRRSQLDMNDLIELVH